MANFTPRDMKIFGKWYGVPDFQQNDKFWQDIFAVYREQLVPLPFALNPITYKMISELLVCPSGACGECCHYAFTALKGDDVQRILTFTGMAPETFKKLIVERDGETGIDTHNGCPFLKNKACSVYEARPAICSTFPIQPGVMIGGVEQIHVRMKCLPALNLVKQAITKTLANNPKLFLLPDLTIIQKEA